MEWRAAYLALAAIRRMGEGRKVAIHHLNTMGYATLHPSCDSRNIRIHVQP